jgi:hypothetical protein
MAISTDKLELLSKDKSLEALKLLLENLKESYGATEEDILELLSAKDTKSSIPLQAFSSGVLSTLEAAVKFMKENLGKTFHEIALLLNRDDRTIWSTYRNSTQKLRDQLQITDNKRTIPFSIFSSRKHSVLESLIYYLIETYDMSISEIAQTLNKDYQTIYTTYRRGKAR